MMNYIWFGMIIAGAVTAAAKGEINLVTEGILKGSEQAVLVVAGLIGMLTFWSGLCVLLGMQVLSRGSPAL